MSSAPLAGDWRHDHFVVSAHRHETACLPRPAPFDVVAVRAHRWIESLYLGNGTEGRQKQLRYLLGRNVPAFSNVPPWNRSGRNVLGQVGHSSPSAAPGCRI
jgi:hypothetical protein